MSRSPEINADSEVYFTHRYNINRPSVGISFRPGQKFGTLRLFIVGRPPSPHGKLQGDHTMAWSAVSRSLEWMFADVTLDEAPARIDQVHKSFYIAFLSSFSHCHELMERAGHMHKYITTGTCPKELLCSWMTEYLMTYTYIRNSLPEASVLLPENSGSLGERNALARLKAVEARLQRDPSRTPPPHFKEDSLQALSTLIDKRAIQATIQKSASGDNDRSLQQILTFHLIGIHDLLQSLPCVRRLFFGNSRDNTLLSACLGQVTDDLLTSLVRIILYFPDQQFSHQEHQMNKINMAKAMAKIAMLSAANSNSYADGGLGVWH